MEYQVTEHRPGTKTYAALRRELREYNRSHPKPVNPMPHGWWIAPGLLVAVLGIITAIAVL